MNEEVIAVFIPIVAIVMSLSIPIVFQILDYRRRRDMVEALHRQNMAAIERGIEPKPMPEELLNQFRRSRHPRSLLTGMIWLFVGISLYILLAALVSSEPGMKFVGLIPGGVGLAYLIYYFVEGRHEKAELARAGSTKVVLAWE